ncbi:MAG: DUF4129 domain-containing protein [Trichocoleus desertorum ATA4-8-CV12]|jgi:hypothetical protein|nr:DUF4129 domain-containing protein [Trichocoleus desertorum ATA4-8-CV12]
MPTGSFEKTNISWQTQQLLRQAGEWIELQLSKLSVNPDRQDPQPLPSWLTDVIESFLRVAFWLLAGFCLLWIVWQLLQTFWPSLRTLKFPAWLRRSRVRPATNAQVSQLDAAGWFQRSQDYQRQGNYPEAFQALYFALLQYLSETNLVPLEASRTNGEYWQLVQHFPQASLYQLLITTHEQLRFNNMAISLETLNRCQKAYQEIESRVPAGSHPS